MHMWIIIYKYKKIINYVDIYSYITHTMYYYLVFTYYTSDSMT